MEGGQQHSYEEFEWDKETSNWARTERGFCFSKAVQIESRGGRKQITTFQVGEMKRMVERMKNNKAPGAVQIINETVHASMLKMYDKRGAFEDLKRYWYLKMGMRNFSGL